ncbi:MAG: hypothetical protein R3224_01560 [Balneolaceae bacterium]|nr:hypothetical protein [Balneolaceae bacterium]
MDYFKKGNEALLDKTKWGILASRATRPETTQKILDMIDTVNEVEETFISGWHSPIEKEIHFYLVHKTIDHIHAEAKGLPYVSCSLSGQDVLFLTHCGEEVRRIDRKHALKRNRLICELADKLIIPWLDPNGDTYQMVREVCDRKPVLIFDTKANNSLLEAGAEPFEQGA